MKYKKKRVGVVKKVLLEHQNNGARGAL